MSFCLHDLQKALVPALHMHWDVTAEMKLCCEQWMCQVREPIIWVYFWELHLKFFTLCMHQWAFNLVTHAAGLGSEALTQAMPGATCTQSLCKHIPATKKQVSTLIRRAEKYLWEMHIFSLLSCVRICVRGAILLSNKNEKMNIQFNYILGDLFSQSMEQDCQISHWLS